MQLLLPESEHAERGCEVSDTHQHISTNSYMLVPINGGILTAFESASDAEAIAFASEVIGGSPVAAQEWQNAGLNDDDEPMLSLLFWADQETAGHPWRYVAELFRAVDCEACL
jgi:hypothetical protein